MIELLDDVRGIEQYNPIREGCVLYVPFWHRYLRGSTFKSVDRYQHLATVTGATHKPPEGRDLDGVDDVITIPAATSINNIWDGGGSIWAWIKPDSDGQNDRGRLCGKGWGNLQINDESAGNCDLKMEVLFDGVNNGTWSTTARDLVIGAWNFVVVTYNSGATTNNPIFYVDAVSKGITESTTPVGTRVADTANLGIGNETGGGSAFDGIHGEQGWYPSKILTAAEVSYIYRETRGRHS